MSSLSVEYKPIPKPRTSLFANKKFIKQSSINSSNCDSKSIQSLDSLDESIHLTSNMFFKEQQSLSLGLPPLCPVNFPYNLTTNSVPPPLPPRNVNTNLQSSITLNSFIPTQKLQNEINSIAHSEPYELLENFDSITLSSFHNNNCNIINSNNKSSSSSELLTDMANCSFESVGDLTSNYCDSIIYSGGNNFEDLNKEELIQNDYKSVGEFICFSGWVRLIGLPLSCNLKKDQEKRCWAIIRSNQLIFAKDDEVYNLI